MNYVGPAEETFAELLDALAVSTSELRSSLRLEGEPPVLDSPHRISLAGGLALLAQGAAVAALWEQRGGRSQEIRLEARDAVFAMNPFPWLRRNGHPGLSVEQLAEPCGGYFPTRDGRVFFVTAFSPKLRDGALRVLGCPNDRDAVAAAIAGRDGEELEQAFVDAGLTGALVRSGKEWLEHPQGRLLAQRPVVEIERIGDSPPEPLGPGARPLDGIRVADMTHVFAGPTLTRCLAEQGADVLHLGSVHPKLVDPTGFTLQNGIGKRSAIIDFSEGDAQLLANLLRDADVFVECWRPGVLKAHGFGPAQVAAMRPGMIYLSVSCYGLEGPWGRRGGFDPLALASTGMTEDEARRDTYKLSPPGILTDGIAGFLGAAAIASTLARRALEGGTWHIRISLARMATWIQSLGPYPEGTPADGDIGAPCVRRMESPFGTLDYVAPALHYSETAAYFDKPPVPVGASRADWLPRRTA